jgi:flagellar basal body-associated protein FliL
MQQMMPQSSSYIDLILQYKWIIIALIAAFVYMRYFNKKPKEEEKKA